MKERVIISVGLLILCVNVLLAQKRSAEQALGVAREFAKCIPCDIRPQSLYILTEQINPVYGARKMPAAKTIYKPYYIFTDSTENASFIIVSGDERMKRVLGYSKNGAWLGDQIPPALAELLHNYSQQYDMLQAGEVVHEHARKQINIPTVAPLLQTTWDQGVPYNLLCPTNCPSGCVATAMSQVMYFHQYPMTGQGSFSYTSHTCRYKCSFDFSSAIFNWDMMKHTYSGLSFDDSDADNSVAQIMYACGVSVGMDYDKSGSGAYMSDIPYALIHFFGYNDNVSYCQRTYYAAEEWYAMLTNELANGRPVLYGGSDSRQGGHAFVIDGSDADNGMFHVNWGWGESFDGYYNLDALDPDDYRFSSYQQMIIYVSPEEVGTHRDVFYANKFAVSSDITIGKTVLFTISDVYCYSSQSSYAVTDAKFSGTLGIGLFDEDFNFLSPIASEEVSGLNNFNGYDKVTYCATIQKSMFPKDGCYHIAPYIKEKDSPIPTRIRTTGGAADYIRLTITEEDINWDGNEEPEDIALEWEEDFEDMRIPTAWKQTKEHGTAEWKPTYVLMASADMPEAAHGNGYIYLSYSTDGIAIYNDRAVTRLATSNIPLSPDFRYNLSFQYRMHATQPNPTDIIIVYYEQNGRLQQLAEIQVTNQGEWNKVSLQLPVTGNVKLVFEGSTTRGSVIYLDDLKIYEREDDMNGVSSPSYGNGRPEDRRVYNIYGELMGDTAKTNNGLIRLPKGIYILQTSSGDNRKIFIKPSN